MFKDFNMWRSSFGRSCGGSAGNSAQVSIRGDEVTHNSEANWMLAKTKALYTLVLMWSCIMIITNMYNLRT